MRPAGIMFCDHGPTHIDSVSHLSRDPNVESVDQLSLEKCLTPAICIDVSDVPIQTQFGRSKIEQELKRWGAGHQARGHRAVLYRPL